jgi:hypothetical protein
MKRIGNNRKMVNRILFILMNIVFVSCSSVNNKSVFLENNFFRYEISSDGRNMHFIDKTGNRDYLSADSISYCAYVVKEGKIHYVTSVELKARVLIYNFNSAGVKAVIRIKHRKDQIGMRVEKITGVIESMTFINVPLNLEGMPYEPFAACVLSMNLFTNVRQLPALQTELWASCFQRFGLENAEITLIGVPQKNILPVIREVMKHAENVPFSDKGGAWAQQGKEGYGSYLMDFGSLTEETVEETIERCRNLGFNQVTIHGGGFFKHGEFELDPSKWPEGWENFKRINKRLHEAGISSILLTYTFFMDKRSKYVTPVASEDLGYFNSFTLSDSLGTDENEIVVNESTEGISLITGYFVRNSSTLRIGGELIEFKGVSTSPPFKFTGCKRGVNGTKVTTHPAGEKAFHLREMFGLLVPGPETELFSNIAKRTAQIVDECDFDGIYFDAIDGNDLLGGKENAWYYGTKFVFEVARNLKKPVGMEMCDMPHHYWHYSSRWQAWDRPVRGYKRFIDVHLAASKSEDHRHGEWMGHTPVIDKLAAAENGRLLLPLHLGWWSNYTWNPPQIEPTFTDDVEYLCCKMIGNNAGLSMLGGVDKKTLDEKPAFKKLIDMIRQYEELRHKNYFNDSIKTLLRQPGKEFTLFRKEDGSWTFKPVTWVRHKVAGTDHPSSTWTITNNYDKQPVKLRIEPLLSVKPFNNSDNILLADFSSSGEFSVQGKAIGMDGGISVSQEKDPGQKSTGSFTAISSGLSPREGSWIKMEKRFDPWLNLEKNQALGVWIKGDGNGEILNLRIESPSHLSLGARGDHFIKIDFTGWNYFELVEIESSEFSNYIWPDEYFNVYNSYFYTVKFNTVDKLQLWYNNIPKDREVNCIIGQIKALPLVPVNISNPSVTIGGNKIIFPVNMESGMYLEMLSETNCKLYGSRGEFIMDVTPRGSVPVLDPGTNKISFSCGELNKYSSRVQVTILAEGDPL